jgi:hypothetical protein
VGPIEKWLRDHDPTPENVKACSWSTYETLQQAAHNLEIAYSCEDTLPTIWSEAIEIAEDKRI